MGDTKSVPFEVASQLCDINFEIISFMEKFENFRKINVIDKVLMDNLSQLIEDIEAYADNEPVQIPSPELSDFDIVFADHHLEQVLYCSLCDAEVRNRVYSINSHINSKRHLTLKEVLRGKFKGDNKLMNDDRKFGKDKNSKKANPTPKFPLHKTLPKKMANFVKSNFFTYVNEQSLVATGLRQAPSYDQIAESLKQALNTNFPNIKVHFFGSRISGLGNPDTDLDIFVDVDDNYHQLMSAEQVRKLVETVKKALERQKEEWRTFTPILSARTPILRVYNHKHRIDCDISFSSLGQCNTLLIKYLLELQPLCQQMCLFIKKWFKNSSFSDCFSSYVFTLMIIFHLQQQNYLPAIFILQNVVTPTLVGPWQGNFAQVSLSELKIEQLPVTDENLLNQLISFFTYFGTVDYAKNIICPYTGTLIPKDQFNNMKQVFSRYETYRTSCSSKKELFQIDKPVCVQDPLEHCHNVAKCITSRVLAVFCQDCRLTVAELKEKTKN